MCAEPPAALLLMAMAEWAPAQRRVILPASLSVLNKTQFANGFCLIYLSVIITLPFSVIYPVFSTKSVCISQARTCPVSPLSFVAAKKGHEAASHLGQAPIMYPLCPDLGNVWK